MCKQMAPPQKELARRTPRDDVRGTSKRMAVASSPAPIKPIGTPRLSFATSSGGNKPRTLAEPARIMIPAIKACNTRPVTLFQFLGVFIVQPLSEAQVAGQCAALLSAEP